MPVSAKLADVPAQIVLLPSAPPASAPLASAPKPVSSKPDSGTPETVKPRTPEPARTPEYYALKKSVIEALIEAIDVSQLATMEPDQARAKIRVIVSDILAVKKVVMSATEQDALVEDVCNDVLGYGPFEPLLARDDIADQKLAAAGNLAMQAADVRLLRRNPLFPRAASYSKVPKRFPSS